MAIVIATPASVAQAFGSPTFGSRAHFTEQGGTAIYGSVCAACHMPNGLGAVGAGSYPSLAYDQSLAAAAYPVAVVLLGQKAMPSFAETLSDQQIAEAFRQRLSRCSQRGGGCRRPAKALRPISPG
jgi:mono/diheme cytochrome c family protein